MKYNLLSFVWVSVTLLIYPVASLSQDFSPNSNVSSSSTDQSNSSVNLPQTQNSTGATGTMPTSITCPKISELVRDPNSGEWQGKDPLRWKGYEMSFDTALSRFVGAQWQGTNVGQIFCVYHGPEKTAFPVLILFHALVQEPSGGKWSDNQNGSLNCYSANLEDCAFTPTAPPPAENPYQELEQFKSNSPDQELGY